MNRSSRFFAFRAALAALTLPLVVGVPLLTGCPQPDVPDPNATDPNTAEPNSTPPPTQKGDSGLTGKFAGSTRCQLCHAGAHAAWSGTLHAQAYEALEEIGQQNNPDCVGCHTTGWGQPGGWVDRATTNSLAGVGCEACHGGAADHANNASDKNLRPEPSIAASVCGQCHTGEHQPNFDDWSLSRHSEMQESLKEEFVEGTNANTCGLCHSGDVFIAKLKGETITADYLKGRDPEELNPITCAVCHDPHQRTGNAAAPEDGRDYQLRFPQIKYTTPTNTIAAATDPTRFNLCGQCHHARDRVWTDSSREPHPSDQVNVFFGEMPLPASKPDPIIPSRASVHMNTAEQCSTCHVFRKPFEEGIAPTISGHTFEVNFGACVDCHGNEEAAEAKLAGLQAEISLRAKLVKDALDAWGVAHNIQSKGALSWEYTSEGGPNSTGQASIPDNIKKARYIYYYVTQGGGTGAHNPDYVREGLVLALQYVQTSP